MSTSSYNPYRYAQEKNIPWSYASSGGTISTFVADASVNEYNQHGATYRVHVFDNVGANQITFDTQGIVDVLLIGGGGAGGAGYNNWTGGGGGAGGVVQRYGVFVESGSVDIYVGNGGSVPANTANVSAGQDSYFGGIFAYGGGGGAPSYVTGGKTGNGASGGGWTASWSNPIPGQGHSGGITINSNVGAGGGGAGKSGGSPQGETSIQAGSGGDGLQIAFANNTPTYYAGGGAGGVRGTYTSPVATGGLGGGGGQGGSPGSNYTGAAATFYGSGGGGGASVSSNNYWYVGGPGYKGLVVVRYIVNQ